MKKGLPFRATIDFLQGTHSFGKINSVKGGFNRKRGDFDLDPPRDLKSQNSSYPTNHILVSLDKLPTVDISLSANGTETDQHGDGATKLQRKPELSSYIPPSPEWLHNVILARRKWSEKDILARSTLPNTEETWLGGSTSSCKCWPPWPQSISIDACT